MPISAAGPARPTENPLPTLTINAKRRILNLRQLFVCEIIEAERFGNSGLKLDGSTMLNITKAKDASRRVRAEALLNKYIQNQEIHFLVLSTVTAVNIPISKLTGSKRYCDLAREI
jgi:hypothetical protein